ncbi:hypothetical protein ILUMI_08686 [Ignelater luminosus]|uniref:HTH psq-type domain-containing protein n=1 Tax=Ignelater luminosus TaxID=2038154 RepID=A0A8K0D765_IGNLU|nr:hypothetical protein ILUMI_08686 [Ignelater luminosus]
MPRIKEPRRLDAQKYQKYDSKAIKKAVAEVQNSASCKGVAQLYGINRITLTNHVEGIKLLQRLHTQFLCAAMLMFINYKELHLYYTWCCYGPTDARYNCSPSGWMEATQFFDWFTNCFVYETVKKVLREYYQETGYKNVDKLVFPSLMKKLEHSECLSRANGIGGFSGSEIYPLCKKNMMKEVDMVEIIEADTRTRSVPLENQPVEENRNTPSTSSHLSSTPFSESVEQGHVKELEKAEFPQRDAPVELQLLSENGTNNEGTSIQIKQLLILAGA